MKKITLLFYFLGAGIFISNAQIWIGPWSVAGVGMVLQQAHDTEKDTVPGSINPGPAGASQTWVFTTLVPSTVDTLTFTNPAWLPNGVNFPNSNLAIINSTDASELYLENIATGLFVDGVYADPFGQGAMAIQFNPREQLAGFNATYNSTFQNTSMIDTAIGVSYPGFDSARVKQVKYKDNKTDGWGSIQTPLGTYNCLRNREKVITIDTIWIHVPAPPPTWYVYSVTNDTVWHFSWWANGVGFPLLEFDSTHADTIQNIQWLKTLPVIGGVNETSQLGGVNAYPNPSSGKFILEGRGEACIYNCIGEKVYSTTSRNEKREIDLSAQPEGIYFVRMLNEKGASVKKIIINR
ncbi:MAG: T9SS type A sorting domain-containing protein [Bacteroidetes bacterium]|nr:T9SS type A sorting domain-containing protein [Bacteroidota bacterium]